VDSVKYYLILAFALLLWEVIWFLISIIKKRNDIADVAWGLGFVLLAGLAYSLQGSNNRALLVNILVTIWGVRLAWHIHARNRHKPEDFRYAQWRKEWKHVYFRSFLQVYLLQGILLFLIAWPILLINLSAPTPFHWFDLLGVLIWLTGFMLESIGDQQLKKFKSNPLHKGMIITTGLWKYSRHPNYFGEAVQWWGIFVMTLTISYGWITMVSPLVITYLLRYVSGVPMLEKKYKEHADFEKYKTKTSVFFPWFPKGE
jgi:steroid 5-alpha reductase family enzyme